MQKRFDALTGIRAIAAMMVFLYHNRKYWRGWLPEFVIRNLNEYHTGVALFFVLSGFLIAYTYEDDPVQSGKSYTKYILVRLARIFPVYVLLLTIQFMDYGFPVMAERINDYTLLKGLSDVHNLDGIPQSWSLTVELCFYLLAPLLFLLTKQHVLKALLLLLLLCGAAVATGYIWHAVNGNHNKWLYNWWFIFDGTFFGRFPEFFMGMLLAYYCKQEQSILEKLPKKNITLAAGLLCLISIYCMSLFEKDIYSHGTEFIQGLIIRNLILPFFIALLLYGLMTEETWFKKFLSLRVMVLLGNASYIFYLIHIGYINQKMAAKFILFDRNFILLWLIAIGGYLLIEKPIYTVCRKMIKRW